MELILLIFIILLVYFITHPSEQWNTFCISQLFCKHDWEVIKTTHCEFKGDITLKGYTDYETMKIIHGYTSTLCKCKKCGKLVVHKMIGSSQNETK